MTGAAAPGAQTPRPELGASAAFAVDGRLWAVLKEEGRVVARHSDDLCRSWSAPLPVSPPGEPVQAGGEGRPKLAVAASGEIYVTWTSPLAEPCIGGIRFARSHHGPAPARDGDGTLHAVWFTQGPGREGVWYGRLREGGVGGARRVGGDAAAHADLAASGTRLAVAWKEYDGQRTALRALTSADGGRSWISPLGPPAARRAARNSATGAAGSVPIPASASCWSPPIPPLTIPRPRGCSQGTT
jgi:hypothetical protein